MKLELPSSKKQMLIDKLTISAEKLVNRGQFLKAGRLYQESGLYKEGALVFFNYADSLAKSEDLVGSNDDIKVPPIVYKQLYVLAGILTEKYHESNKINENDMSHNKNATIKSKRNSKDSRSNNNLLASVALDNMLQEENDAGKDGLRLLEQGWRPAEAYHYYILLHKQIKENKAMVAQHTAQHLIEYEDILGFERTFSLLALAALNSRQMSLCATAFYKLRQSEDPESSQKYKDLSDTIFSLYNAIDVRPHENLLQDMVAKSYNENGQMIEEDNHAYTNSRHKKPKYPRCIVSGRPLTACQFWMCSVCRHCAFEEEIQRRVSCPLCYARVE